MLIAALLAPIVAAAQESSRPVDLTAAAAPAPSVEVRLTFEGQRPANPWAVVGGGPAVAGHAQAGGRVSRITASGTVGGRRPLTNIDATGLAKSQLAAKKGMAGQDQSLNDWWAERPVLWLMAVAAGVVVLLATGHLDDIPWLSGR
jgi:hypothetical protein